MVYQLHTTAQGFDVAHAKLYIYKSILRGRIKEKKSAIYSIKLQGGK